MGKPSESNLFYLTDSYFSAMAFYSKKKIFNKVFIKQKGVESRKEMRMTKFFQKQFFSQYLIDKVFTKYVDKKSYNNINKIMLRNSPWDSGNIETDNVPVGRPLMSIQRWRSDMHVIAENISPVSKFPWKQGHYNLTIKICTSSFDKCINSISNHQVEYIHGHMKSCIKMLFIKILISINKKHIRRKIEETSSINFHIKQESF
ncbi:hypothetical protein H8356DRAFT_1430559 [Neocallimastix lanati (nom. inval.)]|nr:hypothetical protein H8356DRAFT_1430559 [Neocallimastix sp. JGI-2020a]